MFIEPGVRLGNHLSIKALLAHSGLIPSHQKNGIPSRIKCKGNPPNTVRRVKAQLFHVGVARTVQRIDSRASEQRPEMSQQSRLRQEFVCHGQRELVELRLKLFMK